MNLDEIMANVKWLDQNAKSEDILNKGIVLDKLSIQCVYLAEQVADAYSLMNQCEDTYKIAVADYCKNSTEGVAKSEKAAEVEFSQLKRDWTDAKNGYKRLSMFLERIDKVLESARQRISVVKQANLKNMSGV
jgi:hypothetical protein